MTKLFYLAHGCATALDAIEQRLGGHDFNVGFLRGVLFSMLEEKGASKEEARLVLKDYPR